MALGATLQDSAMERKVYEEEAVRVRSMSASLSSQGGTDLAAYEQFARDVQGRWKARQPEHYGQLVLQICKPLSSGRFSEDRQYGLARELALSALERRDAIPLTLELELTGHVSTIATIRDRREDQQFSQERRKDAEVRVHAWRRLEKAIDPNWDPNDFPVINIVPPAATGLPSGVAPQAIEDPALRAEYEAAIEKNRQKAERYNMQHQLRNWLKVYPKTAEEYLIQAYSMPPQAIEELSGLLTQSVPEERTRTRILDAVKKNMTPSPNSGGGSKAGRIPGTPY